MMRGPLGFAGMVILLALPTANAQTPQAGSPSFERLAPINVTGNWVSVVTEDWTVRMLTPGQRGFRQPSSECRRSGRGGKLGSSAETARPPGLCSAGLAPHARTSANRLAGRGHIKTPG